MKDTIIKGLQDLKEHFDISVFEKTLKEIKEELQCEFEDIFIWDIIGIKRPNYDLLCISDDEFIVL